MRVPASDRFTDAVGTRRGLSVRQADWRLRGDLDTLTGDREYDWDTCVRLTALLDRHDLELPNGSELVHWVATAHITAAFTAHTPVATAALSALGAATAGSDPDRILRRAYREAGPLHDRARSKVSARRVEDLREFAEAAVQRAAADVGGLGLYAAGPGDALEPLLRHAAAVYDRRRAADVTDHVYEFAELRAAADELGPHACQTLTSEAVRYLLASGCADADEALCELAVPAAHWLMGHHADGGDPRDHASSERVARLADDITGR